MQYTLQLMQDTTLLPLLESSLFKSSPPQQPLADDVPQQISSTKQLFAKLPPVLLIDLCRMAKANSNQATNQPFVKVNYALSFPSVMFADRFLLDNADRVAEMQEKLANLQVTIHWSRIADGLLLNVFLFL